MQYVAKRPCARRPDSNDIRCGQISCWSTTLLLREDDIADGCHNEPDEVGGVEKEGELPSHDFKGPRHASQLRDHSAELHSGPTAQA